MTATKKLKQEKSCSSATFGRQIDGTAALGANCRLARAMPHAPMPPRPRDPLPMPASTVWQACANKMWLLLVFLQALTILQRERTTNKCRPPLHEYLLEPAPLSTARKQLPDQLLERDANGQLVCMPLRPIGFVLLKVLKTSRRKQRSCSKKVKWH